MKKKNCQSDDQRERQSVSQCKTFASFYKNKNKMHFFCVAIILWSVNV